MKKLVWKLETLRKFLKEPERTEEHRYKRSMWIDIPNSCFIIFFIFRNNQKNIENQTHSPKMTFRRTKASEDGTQGGFTQVTRRSCHQPNFQTGKSEEGSSAYRVISFKFQIQSILILSVGVILGHFRVNLGHYKSFHSKKCHHW